MVTNLSERNAFTALCKLAAKENWCWNIICTTCGHMYFRYGLRELSRGKHPDSPDWQVSSNHPVLNRGSSPKELGPLPTVGQWPIADQRALANILAGALMKDIASNARFPDWLGYLGLGLLYTEDAERELRVLTKTWTPQLLEMMTPVARSRSHLQTVQDDPTQFLTWRRLEEVESGLMRFA